MDNDNKNGTRNVKLIKRMIIVLVLLAILVIGAVKLEVMQLFTSLDKPVIYLYPESQQEIYIDIDLQGELTCTYPKINEGWQIIGHPNGKILNRDDGYTYDYLFWEGITDHQWVINEGFVVSGEDTAEFLREKLSYQGLNDSEINDFISFWLPEMEGNVYNLVHFSSDVYEELAALIVEPEPDTLIRIFMVFKPLNNPIDIEEQVLIKNVREGFTVVEWGGVNISK